MERQGSLFDVDGLAVKEPPARSQPLRRNSDPGTSHEAAAETASDLTVTQKLVLEFMRHQTVPMTANEIGAACRVWVLSQSGKAKVSDSYRKRANELHRMKFLKPHGRRRCKVTNSMGETFLVRRAN